LKETVHTSIRISQTFNTQDECKIFYQLLFEG